MWKSGVGGRAPGCCCQLESVRTGAVEQGRKRPGRRGIPKQPANSRSDDGRDIRYAGTSFNLGRLYQELRRYDEAETHYLITAEIEEPLLGSTNDSFLQTLRQLASLYEQSGNTEKLAEINQRLSSADPLNTVLSHLPRATFAAAAIQPSALLSDPGLQLLPFEIIEAAGQAEMGFNPLDVEAAIVFATLPITGGQPPVNGGILFRMKDGLTPKFPWDDAMEVVPDQPYLKEGGNTDRGLCSLQFEDGVILLGTEESVRQSLRSAEQTTVAELLLADRKIGAGDDGR